MRGGLCQAIKAKTKMITQPALTESANSGLLPPMDGSIMSGSANPGLSEGCGGATQDGKKGIEGDRGVVASCGRPWGPGQLKNKTGPSARQPKPRRAGGGHGSPARLRLAGLGASRTRRSLSISDLHRFQMASSREGLSWRITALSDTKPWFVTRISLLYWTSLGTRISGVRVPEKAHCVCNKGK